MQLRVNELRRMFDAAVLTDWVRKMATKLPVFRRAWSKSPQLFHVLIRCAAPFACKSLPNFKVLLSWSEVLPALNRLLFRFLGDPNLIFAASTQASFSTIALPLGLRVSCAFLDEVGQSRTPRTCGPDLPRLRQEPG